MKVKLALVIPLVAALAFVLVAGPALGKAGSITGGGRFINLVPTVGNKITFGFNALPTGEGPVADAVGQFHLIDHGSKTRMHGTISSIALTGPILSRFWGSIGEGEVPFTVDITDNGEPGFGPGDIIMITIGTGWTPTYGGVLQGGNIKHHLK